MARSRNIKPGFFDNEILGELPALTRLLFIGLWCLADREGRLQDRPKRIKKELLGYDDVTADDVDRMLQQLCDNDFITRYEVGEEQYIQVTNFLKHQNPHCKEQASIIPAPGTAPDQTVQSSDESLNVGGTLPKKWRKANSEFSMTPAEDAENNDNLESTVQAQCKHSTETVVAGLIPDSLKLIPDSLKTTLPTGEPVGGDVSEPQSSDESLTVVADHVKGRVANSEFSMTPADDAEKCKKKAAKKEPTPDWKTAKTTQEIRFCKFWDAYPRKVGKASAWKAWRQIKPTEELLENMIKTLEQWKTCGQWTKDGGKYIPHPATWLNRGGWEDELQEDGYGQRKTDRDRHTTGFHTESEY